jgi:CheY-like chemotaxis protein
VADVLAVLEDLFFGAKLMETARHLGVPLTLVRPQEEIRSLVRERRPALVILDLQSESARPLEIIRGIKADAELRATRVLGFLSHVQADLRVSAVEAGCDEVLPRSVFTTRLPDILRPYASVGPS